MHGEDAEGEVCDAGHYLPISCTEVIEGKDVVGHGDHHLVDVGD